MFGGQLPSQLTHVHRPDHTTLAVHTYGQTGTPVLAVHGFASTAHANWVEPGWARALAAEGRMLVAPDLRGHGDSDKPHGPSAYRLDALVDDLIAVVDAQVHAPVDVLGYSLGSRLALELAVRAPDRVRTLVLGGADAASPFHDFDVQAARAHVAGGAAIDDDRTAALVAMTSVLPGNDVDALLALVEGLKDEPAVQRMPQQPLLVVCGDRDTIAPDGQALADRAAHGSFLALPGRTHVNAVSSRAFKRAALELFAG